MQNFEATKSNPSQTTMATCKNLTPSQQPDRTRVSLVLLRRLMVLCQEPALNHLTETTQWWFSCPWRGNSPPSATARVGKNSNSDILKLEHCLIPVQSNGEQASDDMSSLLPKKVTEKHFVRGDCPDEHVTTECSNYLHILYFMPEASIPNLTTACPVCYGKTRCCMLHRNLAVRRHY